MKKAILVALVVLAFATSKANAYWWFGVGETPICQYYGVNCGGVFVQPFASLSQCLTTAAVATCQGGQTLYTCTGPNGHDGPGCSVSCINNLNGAAYPAGWPYPPNTQIVDLGCHKGGSPSQINYFTGYYYFTVNTNGATLVGPYTKAKCLAYEGDGFDSGCIYIQN